MKIFLKDTCFSHCLFSNNPLPPIQFSDKIEWDRSKKFTDSDYIIFTDNLVYEARNNNKKDIAWLIEPYELQSHNYEYLRQNYNKFFKILTHDVDLLKLPNAYKIPYGGCWIKKEDFNIYSKDKNFSIVCSNKNYLSGHKFRHECVNAIKEVADIYGNGYNPINYKLESLRNYRYQIVVENVKKDFWFTEKLIDCFVTGTIPIYYGCPSIHEFFDINGLITFNNTDELKHKIANLNSDYYNSKIESIKINFKIAQEYILSENSIYKFFNENYN